MFFRLGCISIYAVKIQGKLVYLEIISQFTESVHLDDTDAIQQWGWYMKISLSRNVFRSMHKHNHFNITNQVKHGLIMHVPLQKSNIPFIGEGPNIISRNTRILWKEGNKGVSCRLPAIREISKRCVSLRLPWNETHQWVQNDIKNFLLEFLVEDIKLRRRALAL